MNTICAIPEEFTPFQIFGLCLQEPMTFVTDLLVAITAFILFFKIPKSAAPFSSNWRKFYFYFGWSTLLGGFGHLFFFYLGIYGKFPSWILAIIASFYAGKAMLNLSFLSPKTSAFLLRLIYVKTIVFFALMFYYQSFLFVLIDAITTYFFFCFGLGFYYWKKGAVSYKYFVIGVGILIPSAFIFVLDYNPSIWFNKNDLSHVFIAITIFLFYLGIIKTISAANNLKLI